MWLTKKSQKNVQQDESNPEGYKPSPPSYKYRPRTSASSPYHGRHPESEATGASPWLGEMTTKRLLLLVILLLETLLLASCRGVTAPTSNSESGSPGGSPRVDDAGEQVPVSGGSYTRILPAELQTMLKDEAFVLVNTHIPFEGNIPGTNLSIPYNEIDQNLEKLPADKNAGIVLYCRIGPMSAEAAETLVGLGYTNVWDLEGGMIAWQEAGLPLEGVS